MAKGIRKGQLYQNKSNDSHVIEIMQKKRDGWICRKKNSGIRESHLITEFTLKRYYILLDMR